MPGGRKNRWVFRDSSWPARGPGDAERAASSNWRAAQTSRPDEAGPVRNLRSGTASPARFMLLQQRQDRRASLPYAPLHGPMVIVPQTSLLLLEAWLPAISVCRSMVALAEGST